MSTYTPREAAQAIAELASDLYSWWSDAAQDTQSKIIWAGRAAAMNLGRVYPRKVGNRTVWACCESSIGPKCGHLS